MRNDRYKSKARKNDASVSRAKQRPGSNKGRYSQRKAEIVFDAEARRKHLQGFSARKRERRVFGLAMQKVKDRKARLGVRQSEREARLEQIEQAEHQKEQMTQHLWPDDDDDSAATFDNSKASINVQDDDQSIEKVERYEDGQTHCMWGGEVVVNISTHFPGEISEEEDKTKKQRVKKTDEQQVFAGKVEKYLPQVKAQLPGKKKQAQHLRKTNGLHGATTMKGMPSNSGDFKLAQKALGRANNKAPDRHFNKRKRK